MKIKFNKKILIAIGLAVLLTIFGSIIYNNYFVEKETKTKDKKENILIENNEPRIEIYYFHRTSRCWSCLTADDYTKEVVSKYFDKELREGKISYKSINYQQPTDDQEKSLSENFSLGHNTLIINKIKKTSSSREEVSEIWVNLNNKDDYFNLIKNKVSAALKEIQ